MIKSERITAGAFFIVQVIGAVIGLIASIFVGAGFLGILDYAFGDDHWFTDLKLFPLVPFFLIHLPSMYVGVIGAERLWIWIRKSSPQNQKLDQ